MRGTSGIVPVRWSGTAAGGSKLIRCWGVLVAAVLLTLTACVESPLPVEDEPAGWAANLVATQDGVGIELTWDAGESATSWEVQWRPAGGGTWASTVVDTPSARITGLAEGVTHQFRVRGRDVDPAPWSETITHDWYPTRLPVLYIETAGRQPVTSKEVWQQATWRLEPNGHAVQGSSGTTEIRGRGNSTWVLPKKPYRLRLSSAVPLAGMPSDRHWVLLANHYDRSQLRNVAGFGFAEQTGLGWTPRRRHVEVVFNGRYDGVYLLAEHARVAPHRIPLDTLGPNDDAEPEITGGYHMEIDFRWTPAEQGFRTGTYDIPIALKDPDPATPAQRAYIEGVVNAFEEALASPNFTDPNTGYRAHIDVDSWIDTYLIFEVTRNQDAFRGSTFLRKPRGELLRFGHVWDFDLSAGRHAGVPFVAETEGWHSGLLDLSHWIVRALEDPWFRDRVAQRWIELRPRFLEVVEGLDEIQAPLIDAIHTDGLRWERGSLSPSDTAAWLQDWFRARIAWIDSQLQP